jgi:hypothetical protein
VTEESNDTECDEIVILRCCPRDDKNEADKHFTAGRNQVDVELRSNVSKDCGIAIGLNVEYAHDIKVGVDSRHERIIFDNGAEVLWKGTMQQELDKLWIMQFVCKKNRTNAVAPTARTKSMATKIPENTASTTASGLAHECPYGSQRRKDMKVDAIGMTSGPHRRWTA